ncbi:hypothetical protein V428_00350 [Aeromonas hydrophila subsp. hydrophila AL09-71]|nr:hypothetical protein V428_00350 [Aeromonas hydrophila subsp. hydrophila AL09-71]KYQ06185.1 hypothetical protein AW872_19580 [Aeromonas hydrophila]KYQ06906.1 hypothetical protein AW875_19405 [Aeromonas hydrophila]
MESVLIYTLKLPENFSSFIFCCFNHLGLLLLERFFQCSGHRTPFDHLLFRLGISAIVAVRGFLQNQGIQCFGSRL